MPVQTGRYDAVVRRTALGIPHIRANDMASAGYGYGYAHAEDNLCVLQEDLVTIRGERAKYFGRNGTHYIVPNGSVADNVSSDFFWKFMATDAAWQHLKATADPELLAVTQGFVDGYNRYVRELRAGGHAGRHASCRSAPWLFEITEGDMYRRYYRLALIASSSVFVDAIAELGPPAGGSSSGSSAAATPTAAQLRDSELAFFLPENRDKFGSNMYAIGKDGVSAGRQSMVFGNPHFPWSGTERLYIAHLTVPGKVDIMGASLYRSHFGPMMTITSSGQRILPWTTEKAYTMRDANAENDRLINQFARWNQARSLDEFVSLHKTVLGIPWVNTVASGPNGPAYYGDVSVVPHVTDAKLQTCAAQPIHGVVQQVAPGLPVLDGSRSACEWGDDTENPDADGVAAPAPGIFGPANLPTLQRTDWVHNCNDSYWLTNPAEPITGYNSIIGAENTARSLRTRLCIQHALRHLGQDGADGLGTTYDANGDQRFDLDELQETVLSSQIYSAQLARDDVVANICPLGIIPTAPRQASGSNPAEPGGAQDVSEACTVLGAWSTQSNLDDVGSHIWREFFRLAAPNPAGVGPNPGLWSTPFSADDPVNTPRDLNYGSALVQEALGRAVWRVEWAGVPMNAQVRDLQRSGVIGDNVIPIFGGTGTEGAFTIVSPNNLDADGYRIVYGNSYIQTVTWEPDGAGFKPRAEGFITYSQSTDPANPHYFDFTQEYSAKRWHRFPFEQSEVIAQTERILFLHE